MSDFFDEIIDKFNEGDTSFLPYFGKLENFFLFLKKKGLIDRIDPINNSESSEWQNEYLLWLFNNDKETFYMWMDKMLSDVYIDENNQVFLELGSLGELSEIFCDKSRNSISPDRIQQILDGEVEDDLTYVDHINIYDDVIDNLNAENKNILKTHIIDSLKSEQISPETDLLEEIASEQGHDDYVEINSDNISMIFNDSESLSFILDEYLEESASELRSVYSMAYESSYYDELYRYIWRELDDFFNKNVNHLTREVKTAKTTKNVDYVRIPILGFDSMITDFLEENKKSGLHGTIEYQGSYLNIFKDFNGCLSVVPPDYADYGSLIKNINSYFSDYF